ncbi:MULTISPECIES: hypothetical protein [unclassified Trichocoleus]|uniref:hypothetical protein n=1 Tax=unclassified Trichocoleus TaxID=2628910 RepID=UPI0018EF662A|nr:MULTISPECIES: hypothetical protein [unclassified Trichocoleus]
MSSPQKIARRRLAARRNLWFERVMAILASANLLLVLFDVSYIPLRDFYLLRLPRLIPPAGNLTKLYDPIKGIEPHRDTQNYLQAVADLEAQVEKTGISSPEVEPYLEQLRNLSTEMVDTDPFRVADKSGTLEKIKNRMREHIYDQRRRVSSRQSFNRFWSQDHLLQAGWRGEIDFFNQEIRPLIATNYFRSLGETGDFVSYFWRIDLPFAIVFGVEFLARTFYISRRHKGVSWLDAMLWRWYDVFLWLPFWFWLPSWRLLRIIPVTIRLHQAKLVDLDFVIAQINRGFVANFAEELTEVVVIRVINQIQGSVQRGEVTRWLFRSPSARGYIDINNTNEVEAIATLLVKLVVYEVLPKIQPDLEAILRHSVESGLRQLPLYQGLQQVPGVRDLPTQLADQVVTNVTQTAYQALVAALEDPVGAQLSSQLVQHFAEALGSEVQNQQTLHKIQGLLSDLLEEVKVNYIQRLSEEDMEGVLEQTHQLHQIVKK